MFLLVLPAIIGLVQGAVVTRRNICGNEDCKKASETFLKHINASVDPCDDFFEFSCGKFIAEAAIPDEMSSLSSFSNLGETILERGRRLLEAEYDEAKDFSAYRKAKNFYASCINETQREATGVEPLMNALASIGGWPVLRDSDWSPENWWETINAMARMGFDTDHIISLGVGVDEKNTSGHVLIVDQPRLGLDKKYLLKGKDDKDVANYLKFMVDTAVLLGARNSRREIRDEMSKVVELEIELAKISLPDEKRRNSSQLYNPTTLGKLAKSDQLPPSWPEYATNVLFGDDTSWNIGNEEKVIVMDKGYVSNVSRVLASTSRRTLANYLAWRMARSSLPYLSRNAREIVQDFVRAMKGVKVGRELWKDCVESVGFDTYSRGDFAILAASMYVRTYFDANAKREVAEMTRKIRRSFGEIIDNLDWMDGKTKARARAKLDAISQMIGYPEQMTDESLVNEIHARIYISADDYWASATNLSLYWTRYFNARLRKSVVRNNWIDSSVAVVNAFYDPSVNGITFPAGILQGVFFNENLPDSINYGAIGAIIGHEITHGFDDNGRQRDENGEVKDWWEVETDLKFRKKVKCIIDQYSSYFAPEVDLHINGKTTQGENIADNGGIHVAYNAYVTNTERENEESLPDLDYTPRQMFWLSFGQVWCTKYRNEALKHQILTNEHAPGKFRLIGVVSNSNDFAKDFSCPKSSKMNAVRQKCTVW